MELSASARQDRRRCGDRRYLGKGDAFDRAIAQFAHAYADQTQRDYERLREAVKAGTIVATLSNPWRASVRCRKRFASSIGNAKPILRSSSNRDSATPTISPVSAMKTGEPLSPGTIESVTSSASFLMDERRPLSSEVAEPEIVVVELVGYGIAEQADLAADLAMSEREEPSAIRGRFGRAVRTSARSMSAFDAITTAGAFQRLATVTRRSKNAFDGVLDG